MTTFQPTLVVIAVNLLCLIYNLNFIIGWSAHMYRKNSIVFGTIDSFKYLMVLLEHILLISSV